MNMTASAGADCPADLNICLSLIISDLNRLGARDA
jgi:hypothetical protein